MGRDGENTRTSLLAQRACSLVFSKLLTLYKKGGKKKKKEEKKPKKAIVYLMNEHVQFNTWRLILLGESASEFHWCWYSLCVVLFQSPDCFLFFGANASRVSSFECSKDRISNSHLILHSFPVFYFVSVAAVYNSSSCILPFFAGKCCMLNKIFYKIFFDEWWHGHWRRFLLSLEIEFWEMLSFMRFC